MDKYMVEFGDVVPIQTFGSMGSNIRICMICCKESTNGNLVREFLVYKNHKLVRATYHLCQKCVNDCESWEHGDVWDGLFPWLRGSLIRSRNKRRGPLDLNRKGRAEFNGFDREVGNAVKRLKQAVDALNKIPDRYHLSGEVKERISKAIYTTHFTIGETLGKVEIKFRDQLLGEDEHSEYVNNLALKGEA